MSSPNDAFGRRIGTAVTILMSAAALGSSWAGYEAARWSGKQAALGNEAISLRTRSTRASTLAGQLRAIDVALFTSWLTAFANGDTTLARFEERRFRSEFKPAFERWANQPGSPWIRRALLAMALLFFCAGAYRLIAAPRA